VPDLKTSAQFLLVVEKDASFQHILGSNFIETMGPCIVATVCIAVYAVLGLQHMDISYCKDSSTLS